MKTSALLGALAGGLTSAAPCAAALRNIIYFDQYHVTALPPRDVASGFTHVVVSFANSSLFVGETPGEYKPFMEVSKVRAMFDNGTQVGVALGGWGDTKGFGEGAKTETSRQLYAKNIAAMAEKFGFDFIDLDWEYCGGNGADYKQIPNSDKVDEITTFPTTSLLLKEIKNALGHRNLSIAVPGLARDMLAYTPEKSPSIFEAVDWVNIMTYDLMNRRDTETTYHTSVQGSLEAVERYLALGLAPAKANLGFAMYAKYFETKPGEDCSQRPIGCPIVKAENDDGSDAGTSGAMTFEKGNLAPEIPTNLTTSPTGSCGTNTFYTCKGVPNQGCCSQYGFCGSTPAHCGIGCQAAYGTCTGPDISSSFIAAYKDYAVDESQGGAWYWDRENALFWSLDTVPLMQRKFQEIVAAKGLGGVMAWSFGEDSYDYSHLKTITAGVRALSRSHTRRA